MEPRFSSFPTKLKETMMHDNIAGIRISVGKKWCPTDSIVNLQYYIITMSIVFSFGYIILHIVE